jgi:hypothetical protein
MALQVLHGPVIAAGQSLSDGLDCTAGSIVRFTMPAAWNGSRLTFQISSDGAGYNDLVDPQGREISFRVKPGSAVVVGAFTDYLKAVAFLKMRSGTRRHPLAQTAQREFAVAIEVL